MAEDKLPIVCSESDGGMENPAGDRHCSINNSSHRYEELMGESVPCPTCRGLGRVPRGHPSVNPTNDQSEKNETTVTPDESVTTETNTQRDPRGRKPKPPEEEDAISFQIEKEIYDRVKQELKEQKVSQEVFAAVALGRTQGTLSDMLRKAEFGLPASTATRANLRQIDEFLQRPLRERQRLYKGYRMESREKRRIRREYYEDSYQPEFKKRTMISAHANAVMMQYYAKISDTPDEAGLDVMEEVLNLDRVVIEKFFKNERKKKSQDETL